MWRLATAFLFVFLLLCPAQAFAQFDDRFEGRDRIEYNRAAEAVNKAFESDFQLGKELGARFGLGGPELIGFEDTTEITDNAELTQEELANIALKYRQNELDRGDPNGFLNWMVNDTVEIVQSLGDCIGFRPVFWTEGWGACQGFEFFWPETVVTVNDYGRSTYFQREVGLASTFAAWNDATTDFFQTSLLGLNPKDGLPINEMNKLHRGRSATEPGGVNVDDGLRNFEAHAFSSGFVLVWNEVYQELKNSGDPITRVLLMLFSHCFPSRKFVFHMSEMIPPHWRIAELSSERMRFATREYRDHYRPVLNLERETSRTMFGRYSHNPTIPDQDLIDPPYEFLNSYLFKNKIRTNMCASYRAARGHPIDDALNASLWSPLDKLEPLDRRSDKWKLFERQCYSSTFGELYPLIGYVQNHSASIAPLLAARRMMEWASWPGWWRLFRIQYANFFNDDHGQKQLFRQRRHDKGVKYEDRRPDRIQRLFPNKTECFTTKDVKDDRRDLFPRDLMKPEHNGEQRFVFWNRRRCGFCMRAAFWNDPKSAEE